MKKILFMLAFGMISMNVYAADSGGCEGCPEGYERSRIGANYQCKLRGDSGALKCCSGDNLSRLINCSSGYSKSERSGNDYCIGKKYKEGNCPVLSRQLRKTCQGAEGVWACCKKNNTRMRAFSCGNRWNGNPDAATKGKTCWKTDEKKITRLNAGCGSGWKYKKDWFGHRDYCMDKSKSYDDCDSQ